MEMPVAWQMWATPAGRNPQRRERGHLCFDGFNALLERSQGVAYIAAQDINWVPRWVIQAHIGFNRANARTHNG